MLSVKSDEERIYCGLNNGCVQVTTLSHYHTMSVILSSPLSCQVWDLEYLAKVREQECHDKGVKCIDVNKDVILTGSYDAMFKVGPLLYHVTHTIAVSCHSCHCCSGVEEE